MLRSLLLLAFKLMCTIFSVLHKDKGNGSLSFFFLSFFKSPFHSVLKQKGKNSHGQTKTRSGAPYTDGCDVFRRKRETDFYSQQLQLGKRLISNFTFVFLTISFSLYLFCYYGIIEVGVLVNVDRSCSKKITFPTSLE